MRANFGHMSASRQRMLKRQDQPKPLLGRWIFGRYQSGHLDAYRDWMIGMGRTTKQANEVFSRARKMIRLCHWRTIEDVNGEALELAVSRLLRHRRGLSLKTCNDYLKAPAQLCRWMARPKIGRAASNPLADIEYFNAATDPRHPRRALEPGEFDRLVASVRRIGRVWGRMSAADRVMYYLLKLHTGLRNQEVASLTPEAFDLGEDFPSITVAAAYSKHRRADTQPILPDLAGELVPWLAGKTPGQRVFAVPAKPNLMWRADLAAAGIEYCRDGAYADLYALRHTFATQLGRSGASIKTVQTLMRHSDVRLTARYMHATLHDEMAALRALPLPSHPERRMTATGTYGPAPHPAGLEPATLGSEDRRSGPASVYETDAQPVFGAVEALSQSEISRLRELLAQEAQR